MKPLISRMALAIAGLLLAGLALADTTIEMHAVDSNGIGKSLGKIVATESKYGVILTPNLKGLSSGLHGFHVHQNPNCAPMEKNGKMVAALGAGSHYDPKATKRHSFPWGTGHLGDLPALFVDENGNATSPVLAPRLKLIDLQGRTLMIHSGGDNYADKPQPLGGGGSRVACGVIR